MRSHPSFALFLLATTVPLGAQLQPGTYLACTNGGTAAQRGVFVVDRFRSTVTPLTILGINWSGTGPVRVFIEDRNNFLLGAYAGASHIFRVSYSGGTWSATLLTSAGGIPLLLYDLARINNTIYATSSSGGATATDAKIYTIPAAGGAPPALYHNIGPAVVGLPSAMCVVGTKLHVFMWNSLTTNDSAHISVDTAVTPPATTSHGLLPPGRGYPCANYSLLPRSANFDPTTGFIVIGGRLRDLLVRTTFGVDIQHTLVTPSSCSLPNTDWVQSLALNTDTGDILVGDGTGNFEERKCAASPFAQDVAALPSGPSSFVNDVDYFAGGNLFREVAPGTSCAQTGGRHPCSGITDLPRRGTSFRLTVQTTATQGWLVIGAAINRVDLTPLGAPGCWFGPALHQVIPVQGTGGLGISVALPANLPAGAQAYTQWVLRDRANSLGLVTSDTRQIKP